jgi:hypothetical protein
MRARRSWTSICSLRTGRGMGTAAPGEHTGGSTRCRTRLDIAPQRPTHATLTRRVSYRGRLRQLDRTNRLRTVPAAAGPAQTLHPHRSTPSKQIHRAGGGKQIHRAGGAFVHRLRERSASALRLPRTAPRGDFDLIALRARCRTTLRHPGRACKREPLHQEHATRSEPSEATPRPSASGRSSVMTSSKRPSAGTPSKRRIESSFDRHACHAATPQALRWCCC